METVDYATYVTCEPNECKDCDLLRTFIRRMERLTAIVKQVAASDPDCNDEMWTAVKLAQDEMEALKEETLKRSDN